MKRNNRIFFLILSLTLVFSILFTAVASARNVSGASVGDDEIERGVAWEMLNSKVYDAEDLINAVGNDFTDNYRTALKRYQSHAKSLLDSTTSTTAELNEMYADLRFIIGEQNNPANHARSGCYTVAFTNNGGWSDPIHLYNWSDDGGEISAWPGETMRGAYTNEYGQKQYYAFVPMDVPNIVINSAQLDANNGNVPCVEVQTVDITVLGNTGYYLIGSRDNQGHYKVSEWELKDPVYKTFDPTDPDPTVPTEDTTQKPTERPTQPIPEGDYYLVLEKDNWALKESLRLTKWSDSYCSSYYDISLTTDDRVKVAYSLDGKAVDRWYPSAEDEGFSPFYSSQYYHVEFYPYGNGNYESYKGYIRATPCEPPIGDPTEPPTEFNIDDYIPNDTTMLEFYEHAVESSDQEALRQLITAATSMLAPGNSYTPEYIEKLSRVRNFAVKIYNDDRSADNELKGALNMLQAAIDDKSYEEIIGVMRQWFNMPESPDPTQPTINQPTDSTEGEWLNDPIQNHLVGDADDNGEITVLDATRIQRVLVDFDKDKRAKAERYASITGTSLSILDATAIQRYLVGFENQYGIGRHYLPTGSKT